MTRVIGIVPAAGAGTRMQPLAFLKEVLPIAGPAPEGGERPKAVSEFLVERMLLAGADRVCFVISPRKTDIIGYYASHPAAERCFYAVQREPRGLCDAIFRAAPLVHPSDDVLVGLPDTVWFPEDGLRKLPRRRLALLLFPVDRPEVFDAVVTEADGSVLEVQVKDARPSTHWVWGAFRLPGGVFHELRELWLTPERQDEYFGTLVNAYLAVGGRALGVKAGTSYQDVGTLDGYRALIGSRPA